MKKNYIKRIWVITLLFAACTCIQAQPTAIDLRLKVSGITGSSIFPNYVGDIVINSFTYGLNRTLYMGGAGLVNNTIPSTQKFTLSIPNSEISIPRLLYSTCNGTIRPTITLVNIHTYNGGGGNVYVESEKIELYNAIIDAVTTGTDYTGQGKTEVTIVYDRIRRTIKTTNSSGVVTDTRTFGWNLATNTAF